MAKRPHMPVSVQRDAALIALGLEPATVEWHHEPALGLRPYNAETGTWTPDANDPRHIIPYGKEAHKARYSEDRKAIDKTRRNEGAWVEFVRKMNAKWEGDKPRDIKKRHWPKRKMNGRAERRQP